MNASLPSPACDASIGTISPASFRASTAAKRVRRHRARCASTRAAFIGLPASSEIVRATSSCRRPRRPATLTRISARLCAGSGSRIARSAASIARRVSAAPAFATRPTTSPEYGERTSIHSPVSIHSPSMRSFRSVPSRPRRSLVEPTFCARATTSDAIRSARASRGHVAALRVTDRGRSPARSRRSRASRSTIRRGRADRARRRRRPAVPARRRRRHATSQLVDCRGRSSSRRVRRRDERLRLAFPRDGRRGSALGAARAPWTSRRESPRQVVEGEWNDRLSALAGHDVRIVRPTTAAARRR